MGITFVFIYFIKGSEWKCLFKEAALNIFCKATGSVIWPGDLKKTGRIWKVLQNILISREWARKRLLIFYYS